MRKPYQSPGRMKNSSYYIAPVGYSTHDLPHTVASNKSWSKCPTPLSTRPRRRFIIIIQTELLHRLRRHCDAITTRKTRGIARGPSDAHRWLAVASVSVSLTRKITDTVLNGFFCVGRQNWPLINAPQGHLSIEVTFDQFCWWDPNRNFALDWLFIITLVYMWHSAFPSH